MNIGVVELAFLLILVFGPGGLLFGLIVSPLAPLIRFWMFGLLGLTLALGIAALLKAQG